MHASLAESTVSPSPPTPRPGPLTAGREDFVCRVPCPGRGGGVGGTLTQVKGARRELTAPSAPERRRRRVRTPRSTAASSIAEGPRGTDDGPWGGGDRGRGQGSTTRGYHEADLPPEKATSANYPSPIGPLPRSEVAPLSISFIKKKHHKHRRWAYLMRNRRSTNRVGNSDRKTKPQPSAGAEGVSRDVPPTEDSHRSTAGYRRHGGTRIEYRHHRRHRQTRRHRERHSDCHSRRAVPSG